MAIQMLPHPCVDYRVALTSEDSTDSRKPYSNPTLESNGRPDGCNEKLSHGTSRSFGTEITVKNKLEPRFRQIGSLYCSEGAGVKPLCILV